MLATINLQSQSELRQLTAILLGAQVRARSAWVSVRGFSGRGTTGLGLQLFPLSQARPTRPPGCLPLGRGAGCRQVCGGGFLPLHEKGGISEVLELESSVDSASPQCAPCGEDASLPGSGLDPPGLSGPRKAVVCCLHLAGGTARQASAE